MPKIVKYFTIVLPGRFVILHKGDPKIICIFVILTIDFYSIIMYNISVRGREAE